MFWKTNKKILIEKKSIMNRQEPSDENINNVLSEPNGKRIIYWGGWLTFDFVIYV